MSEPETVYVCKKLGEYHVRFSDGVTQTVRDAAIAEFLFSITRSYKSAWIKYEKPGEEK